MTYREPDLSARVRELEAENATLKTGREPVALRVVRVATTGLWYGGIGSFIAMSLGSAIGAGSSCAASCREDDAAETACDYACATQGGQCSEPTERGSICYRLDDDGYASERFTVPREGGGR